MCLGLGGLAQCPIVQALQSRETNKLIRAARPARLGIIGSVCVSWPPDTDWRSWRNLAAAACVGAPILPSPHASERTHVGDVSNLDVPFRERFPVSSL